MVSLPTWILQEEHRGVQGVQRRVVYVDASISLTAVVNTNSPFDSA